MSRFDELIAELCPDGVEYRKLGEVGTFTRGTGIQKKDFVESGMPCIHYGQVYTHYGLCASETKSFISPELYKTRKKANTGDLVIATTSENEEDVCKCVAWLGDEPCAVSGDAYIYSHSLDPKYVAYCFGSESFQKQKTRTITGTKVLRVSGDSMAKYEIPVPPIEVQREIVRILDAFAALTDELTAKLAEEVTARHLQYAYYRDRLLSRESLEALDGKPVEMKRLEDISINGPMYGSNTKAVAYDVAVGYRYIRITDIDDTGNLGDDLKSPEVFDEKYLLKNGNLLFARSGATAGKTMLYSDSMGPAVFAGYLIRFEIDDNQVLPRYVFHSVRTQRYWGWANATKGGGAQPNISAKAYGNFDIPIPSLATQQKVVDILDRFDALTTSLTDGLPAEIEARKAQYAYYRDRLLDFPRKEVAAS